MQVKAAPEIGDPCKTTAMQNLFLDNEMRCPGIPSIAEMDSRFSQTSPWNLNPKPLTYHGDLTSRFTDEHGELVAMFHLISSEAKAKEWDLVTASMKQFSKEFSDHILAEAVKCYVFMERGYVGDPEKVAIIRAFRKEMFAISKVVLTFAYSNSKLTSKRVLQAEFKRTWDYVGLKLLDRITREETMLFPLYEKLNPEVLKMSPIPSVQAFVRQ
jgi:hypothetical protein